jgi:uncharacterized membrane protein YuzA (DUF378 family)
VTATDGASPGYVAGPSVSPIDVDKENSMKPLHWIALVLVIVGAINWGLVGIFQFDLVAALFGGQEAALSRVVYSLLGLSGLIVAATSAFVHGALSPRDYGGSTPALRTR